MRFLSTRKVNSLYEYKMVPARTTSAAVAEFNTEVGDGWEQQCSRYPDCSGDLATVVEVGA